ncbi:hypothetical protein [Streptomyces sp. NBC_00503]|uniref:hypothetical protein n=1 Tax=Streptomyces sp. NBC_00503 TaxID=2903659 RepID=UPI002E811330|nr:hypothetical protein [Streptomyces sp. NBC_00503]WUD85380.1 hypothetical protein OG490_35120 [Streptomyces sp. NBC_00503]
MNTTPAPDHTLSAPAARDHSRLWSAITAALFVPGVVAAFLLTLVPESAARCLNYGEECASGLSPRWFVWGAGVAAVAFVVAMAAPVVRVRQAAVVVQILAECAALLVILSYV